MQKHHYYAGPTPIMENWDDVNNPDSIDIEMKFDIDINNVTHSNTMDKVDLVYDEVGEDWEIHYDGGLVTSSNRVVLGGGFFSFVNVDKEIGFFLVADPEDSFFSTNDPLNQNREPESLLDRDNWDYEIAVGDGTDGFEDSSTYVPLAEGEGLEDEDFLANDKWEVSITITPTPSYRDYASIMSISGKGETPGNYVQFGDSEDLTGDWSDELKAQNISIPNELYDFGAVSINQAAVGLDGEVPVYKPVGTIKGQFTDKSGNPPSKPVTFEVDGRPNNILISFEVKTDSDGYYEISVPHDTYQLFHYGGCLNHVIDYENKIESNQTVDIIPYDTITRDYELRKVKQQISSAKDMRSIYFCDAQNCPEYDNCFASEGFELTSNIDITTENLSDLTGGPNEIWQYFTQWESLDLMSSLEGNNHEIKVDIPVFYQLMGNIKNLEIDVDLTESKFENMITSPINATAPGPLAYLMRGNLQNVHTKGIMTGLSPAGIVGIFDNRGTPFGMDQCSSKVKLNSFYYQSDYVGNIKSQYGISNFVGGGLATIAAGTFISNSYYKGTAELTNGGEVAGLVGSLPDTDLHNCYAVSDKGYAITSEAITSNMDNIYFNSDRSVIDNGFGRGLTGEDLQKPYNQDVAYIGWDFSETWYIYDDENDGYPVLRAVLIKLALYASAITNLSFKADPTAVTFLNYDKVSEALGIGIELNAELTKMGNYDELECFFQYDIDPDFKYFVENTEYQLLTELSEFGTKIPEDFYKDDFSGYTGLSQQQSYYVRAGAKVPGEDTFFWSEIVKIPPEKTQQGVGRNEKFISAPINPQISGEKVVIESQQTVSVEFEIKSDNKEGLKFSAEYMQDFNIGDRINILIPGLVVITSRIIEIQEETTDQGNNLKITIGKNWPDMIEKIISRNNQLDAEIRK